MQTSKASLDRCITTREMLGMNAALATLSRLPGCRVTRRLAHTLFELLQRGISDFLCACVKEGIRPLTLVCFAYILCQYDDCKP